MPVASKQQRTSDDLPKNESIIAQMKWTFTDFMVAKEGRTEERFSKIPQTRQNRLQCFPLAGLILQESSEELHDLAPLVEGLETL